ncbi:hypothetical protein [Nostoc sp.]|uniref:hypothetical protein n=1 Tax=Nostoc sp. TaxID=1180 RepID=UPI002FF72F96
MSNTENLTVNFVTLVQTRLIASLLLTQHSLLSTPSRRQVHLMSYGSHHCHLTLNKVTLVLKKIQKTLDEGEFYLTQSPSSEGAITHYV